MRTVTLPSLACVACGFLYCLTALANNDAITCAGAGCSLYAGLEFMGLSFYAWGTILFAFLLLAWGKSWFHYASLLALGADIPFLVWQGFMIPCTSCLTVSVLLTLNACMARAPARAARPVRGASLRRLVIFSAIVLICFGFINIFKEIHAPWSITGWQNTNKRLFFSPSCGPCRKHIQDIFAEGALHEIALIPVARGKGDVPVIRSMAEAYRREGHAGLLTAMLADSHAPVEPIESLRLMALLHWNQGHLARSGGHGLPWYSGTPEVRDRPRPVFPSSSEAGCSARGNSCSLQNGGWPW